MQHVLMRHLAVCVLRVKTLPNDPLHVNHPLVRLDGEFPAPVSLELGRRVVNSHDDVLFLFELSQIICFSFDVPLDPLQILCVGHLDQGVCVGDEGVCGDIWLCGWDRIWDGGDVSG